MTCLIDEVLDGAGMKSHSHFLIEDFLNRAQIQEPLFLRAGRRRAKIFPRTFSFSSEDPQKKVGDDDAHWADPLQNRKYFFLFFNPCCSKIHKKFGFILIFDMASIFQAQNCTQSHQGRPQKNKKTACLCSRSPSARGCGTSNYVSFCTLCEQISRGICLKLVIDGNLSKKCKKLSLLQ